MMLGFVTSNARKFSEASQTFEHEGIPIKQVLIDVPEIQASSADEVCRAKARFAAKHFSGAFFIEDSSFHIQALNGFPGVYARYVLETLGVEGVLALLKDITSRACFFRSCIIYQDASGEQHEFNFVREGLYVTTGVEQGTAGWSDLWRIIGITDRGHHYSRLDAVTQKQLDKEWREDNTFTRLIAHIKDSRHV
jgi:XTP/dITP diphosphohydrolase